MAQGKNGQYSDHDLLRVAQEMSMGNKFAESTSMKLRKDAWNKQNAGQKNVPNVPTGNWILGKIRNIDPRRVRRWCHDNARYVAQMAKRQAW